jgi:alpha-tubulin suppressor-like RCC1 family protein
MYHSGIRATFVGVPDIPHGKPPVKHSDRSRAASRRRFAILVPALGLAMLGCKKSATAPNTPAKLVFTVQPSNAPADSSIVPAILVNLEDASGNIVTSTSVFVTLSIGANPGGAVLSGTTSIATLAGIATFPYLSLNKAGTGYTLVATTSTITLPSATSVPFNVTNLTTGSFSSVSAGSNATCGMSTAGAGYCWGNNSLGQLGNGSTSNSTTPFKIVGGLTFSTVGTGSLQNYACGLATGGAAYCWGYNDYGQLGRGNLTNSTSPVAVSGNLTFTALTVGGGGQACGLVAGGAAWCWGWNGSGQLGSPAGAFSSTPVAVSGGLSFSAISAGQNGTTCGIAVGGAAYCWGNNVDGELGNGSTTNATTPVAVSGGLTFKSISAGFASTCGLTPGGAAYCWGDNTWGELGNGSTTNSKTPVAVGGGLTFSAISVGDAFACGVTTAGAAYCWGFNGLGQLGVGTTKNSSTPVPVPGGIPFASISAGYAYACAVTPGGAAYCWGDNSSGQIGNRTTLQALLPELVATPP